MKGPNRKGASGKVCRFRFRIKGPHRKGASGKVSMGSSSLIAVPSRCTKPADTITAPGTTRHALTATPLQHTRMSSQHSQRLHGAQSGLFVYAYASVDARTVQQRGKHTLFCVEAFVYSEYASRAPPALSMLPSTYAKLRPPGVPLFLPQCANTTGMYAPARGSSLFGTLSRLLPHHGCTSTKNQKTQ